MEHHYDRAMSSSAGAGDAFDGARLANVTFEWLGIPRSASVVAALKGAVGSLFGGLKEEHWICPVLSSRLVLLSLVFLLWLRHHRKPSIRRGVVARRGPGVVARWPLDSVLALQR